MYCVLKSGNLLVFLAAFSFHLAAMEKLSYTQVPQSLTMERRPPQKLKFSDLIPSQEHCNEVINKFTESSCEPINSSTLAWVEGTSWATAALTFIFGEAMCIVTPIFCPHAMPTILICGALCDISAGGACCLHASCVKSERSRRKNLIQKNLIQLEEENKKRELAYQEKINSRQHLFWERLREKYDPYQARREKEGLRPVIHSVDFNFKERATKRFAGRSDISLEELRLLAHADLKKAQKFLKLKRDGMFTIYLWTFWSKNNHSIPDSINDNDFCDDTITYEFPCDAVVDSRGFLTSKVSYSLVCTKQEYLQFLVDNREEYLQTLDAYLDNASDMPALIFETFIQVLKPATDRYYSERHFKRYLKENEGSYGKFYLNKIDELEALSTRVYETHPLLGLEYKDQSGVDDPEENLFDTLMAGDEERQLKLGEYRDINEFKKKRDRAISRLPKKLWQHILSFLPVEDEFFSFGWPTLLAQDVAPTERKRWAVERFCNRPLITFYYCLPKEDS